MKKLFLALLITIPLYSAQQDLDFVTGGGESVFSGFTKIQANFDDLYDTRTIGTWFDSELDTLYGNTKWNLDWTTDQGTDNILFVNLVGVDPSGTDNSTNVTVAGQSYATLVGQLITFNLVNLGTHVTGTLGNGSVVQSNVTQHQGALSITESQISDFGTYLVSELNNLATVTWVNVPDANITASSVVQHETALEAVLDLPDLQGAVTDAQVPNTITITSLSQVTTKGHGLLSDIGTNTHGQIDTAISASTSHISNTANPHSTEAGALLSTGEVGGVKFLREDGDGTVSFQSIPGGGDALVANPLSQFAATTSAQLAATISNETGTGLLVFGTAPNITNPTGLDSIDVGLGNVDNTSDATKNAAAATLTNKDISADQINVTNGMDVLIAGTAQNVFEQVDVALLNARATGVRHGGDLNGEGTTTIQIAAGAGAILVNSTPSSPTYTEVTWSSTSIAHTGAILNWVFINSSGTPFVLTSEPTTVQMTENIFLGLSSFNVVIIESRPFPTILQQLADQVRTFAEALGDVHVGGIVTSRAADLTLAQSDMTLVSYGVNSENSFQVPHNKPIPGTSGAAKTYGLADQNGYTGSDVSVVPVGFWDNAGTIEAIGGGPNTSGIWSYYIFPNGTTRMLYPQETYSSLVVAEEAIATYNPTVTAVYGNAVSTTRIAATRTATSFQDDSEVFFANSDDRGSFGSGIAGAIGAASFIITNNLSEGVAATMATNIGVGTSDSPTFAGLTLTGEVDLGANSIGSTVQTATGDGTTTVVWGSGNMFDFQFGAFNETFTFTAPTKPGTFMLKLVQDGTGSRTATWPGTVKWPGGTAATLTTTATTGEDIITFYYNGTSYYAVNALDFQ